MFVDGFGPGLAEFGWDRAVLGPVSVTLVGLQLFWEGSDGLGGFGLCTQTTPRGQASLPCTHTLAAGFRRNASTVRPYPTDVADSRTDPSACFFGHGLTSLTVGVTASPAGRRARPRGVLGVRSSHTPCGTAPCSQMY